MTDSTLKSTLRSDLQDAIRLLRGETLDIELQRYIEQIFPDTMKGSVVAMVPSTSMLAMRD